MTVLWIVAALFMLGALAFMLPPLLNPRAEVVTPGGANLALHRDQLREAEYDLAAGLITPARFAQARAEIERRVLEDTAAATRPAHRLGARRTALALALLVPLASVLTYLQLGDPQAAAPSLPPVAAGAGIDARHAVNAEQIRNMVTALAERMRSDPENVEGWLMLGRSYTALGRYRDAAAALRRAATLRPGDAGLLADLADLLGMAQGKRLAGEPARLVQQALDIDPRHVKALALAGSVAFEAKDYAGARHYWERVVAVVPAGSDMARSASRSLAEAAQLEDPTPRVPVRP